jgi:hypothetical protein
MSDRHFSEVDLRAMLQRADGWSADPAPGRFRIETAFNGTHWRVIVEPDHSTRRLHVVTAFEV